MYLVYNYETGQTVERASTPERAYTRAKILTELYAWINGQTFDYKQG